jgi:hypothetical protein
MASSTSHSKRRVPRIALQLALAALVAWAAGAVYTLYWNPEMRFWSMAAQRKQSWAKKLTLEQTNKTLAVGGSSCAFSVDGQRLLRLHGIPTVNMGLGAGLGAKLLVEWTVEQTRPGDTLVIAFEPGLLTSEVDPTAFSLQFSYLLRSTRWIEGELEPHFPVVPASLLALRPGGYHVATLLGKVVQRRRLFRYESDDVHPDGLTQTPVRASDTTPGHNIHLSRSGRILLTSLRDWCRTNQVRVCYSLPWAWCAPEGVNAFRLRNAKFLLEVSEFLPVLEDRAVGAQTDHDLFADTSWHLNEHGVVLRTDALAEQLRDWRIWNTNELRSLSNTEVIVRE